MSTVAGDTYSAKRKFCADYYHRHKKRILKRQDFVPVSRLDTAALRRVLGTERASVMLEDDELCTNCFRRFRSAIDSLPAEPSTTTSASDHDFVEPAEIIDEINQQIASSDIDVTPLRDPGTIKVRRAEAYVRRKQDEVSEALGRSVRRKISDAYGTSEPSTSNVTCETCTPLLSGIAKAYEKCTSQQQRCQLLTLLPDSLSKKEVMNLVPGATKYLIDKARKLKASDGVWSIPDAYTGHSLEENDITTALRYYLDDEMDCSIQSPNKKDVVHVVKDGKREAVVKRFMTRTVRETYNVFRNNHPEVRLGMTKFYNLRPKYVRITPHQFQCVCTYCANFELIIIAANSVCRQQLSKDTLKSLSLCNQPTEACLFQECQECSGGKRLTLQTLQLNPEDEVVVALWESGDLVKKTMTGRAFIKDVRKWSTFYAKHEHVHNIQRKAIWLEKSSPKPRHVVLHFDFAENWTVNLPNEVQGHYWQRSQISLFTCVAKTVSSTLSLVTVSDDMRHDTAHALFALEEIVSTLEDILPIFTHTVYISDGAAAHFKNRFQFYEMRHNSLLLRWMFSASGHGKNACDGIGGSIKHAASKYNLRSPLEKVILSAKDFVSTLSERGHATRLLYLPSDKVASFRAVKQTEWSSVRPVRHLRSSHVWHKPDGGTQSEVLLARTAEEMSGTR